MYNVYFDESFTEKEMIIMTSSLSIKDLESVREQISYLRDEILYDPIYYQFLNCDSLKKSFHYTQDHREIKNNFISLLTRLPYESFIYIFNDKEGKNKTIASEYFYKFLKQRYNSDVNIIWEKDNGNPVQQSKSFKITELTKSEEPLLSITDYTLAIFRQKYIATKSDTSITRDFERIADKIRFIKNSNLAKPFTRRNNIVFDF